MGDSIYQYVLDELQAVKGTWPTVAEESGIPLRSLEKIARREFKNPGVMQIEILARYFRNRAAAANDARAELRA